MTSSPVNTFKAGSHCSMWMKRLPIKLILSEFFWEFLSRVFCVFLSFYLSFCEKDQIDSACKKEKSLFLSCFGSQPEFRHKTKVSCKIAANDSHLQSFLLDLASVENFSEFNADHFVFFFLGCNLFFGKDIELAKGLKWSRYKRTTPPHQHDVILFLAA